MGYWEMAQMAGDTDLTARVAACAQTQNISDARQWAADNSLRWAASPGWDASWASAIASGNVQPGRDPAVITDGQILSEVQAIDGQPPAA